MTQLLPALVLDTPEAPGEPTTGSQPPTTPQRPAWNFLRSRPILVLFFYSALLALTTFALDGRDNLGLSDEGFLRYGVRAVMHGQVPLRDFQSYDPGRYYWAAGWALLLGDGLVSTRLACSFFQILGVWIALCALWRARVPSRIIALAGLVLTAWMIQRYKLFEQCVALAALYPAVQLIQRPDRRNALLAGVFVGLAAFMGRNHGLYNGVAFTGLIGLLAWKERRPELCKLLGPLVSGMLLGYLPMFLMLAFVPGFFNAFLEPFRVILRVKGTQLHAAVPWPWRLHRAEASDAFFYVCIQAYGLCFLLLPVGWAAVAGTLTALPGRRWREQPALVAAGVIGIPYMHYAFSRADPMHLAHSVPILMAALLVLPAAWPLPVRWRIPALATMAAGVGTLTYFATFPFSPIAMWLLANREPYTEVQYGQQSLNVKTNLAGFLVRLRVFAQAKLKPDDNMLFLPFEPSLYEAIDRFSPLHEIYFLWPQGTTGEQAEIRQLERQHIDWVLLGIEDPDNNREAGLWGTHPLLMHYLHDHFRAMGNGIPPPYVLLHRVDSSPQPPP